MARVLELKLEQLENALSTLQELLPQKKTDILRDAAIQRFEYSAEAFWKMLKTYLAEQEGIEVYSPKEVMREARNVGLLADEQLRLGLVMVEDRNKSTHLYGETMADKIYDNLESYVKFMREVANKVNNNLVK